MFDNVIRSLTPFFLGGITSTTLQHVNLKVLSDAECVNRWKTTANYNISPESQVCAGLPGKSVCSVRFAQHLTLLKSFWRAIIIFRATVAAHFWLINTRSALPALFTVADVNYTVEFSLALRTTKTGSSQTGSLNAGFLAGLWLQYDCILNQGMFASCTSSSLLPSK